MGLQPTKPNTSPSVSPDPNTLYGLTDQESALQIQAQQDAQIAIDLADFPGLEIKGVLGGLPVAEQNQEYFAIVFEAVDTSPEIIDQTQFKVIYLCDSQLNVSKPAQDTVALSNILQNFERQKFANVRVDQGTVLNNQLGGRHKITAVGSLEPICGTQIGKGPLSYVTTMSFFQEGQLGPDLSRDVIGYYQFLNKTVGYQNKKLAYDVSGTTGQGDSYTIADTEEAKLQTYYDGVQAEPSGAGVQATDSQSLFGQNYFDQVKILTSSLDGNTRIKVKIGAMVNIATSSVADIWASYFSGEPQDSGIFQANVTMNVYKEPSTGFADRELIGSKTVAIPTFNNPFSAGGNLITEYSYIYNFWNGAFSTIPGFTWNVEGSARPIVVETDYFDVSLNDEIYAEIVVPEEQTNPTYSFDIDNSQISLEGIGLGVASFTGSLLQYKDRAALRSYQYFGGSYIITQETPEAGGTFSSNITGVTASYYNYTNGEPTASVYNHTGSYWVGYNNFSSSAEGVGSYVTSSTALASFYGGDYIQVNPGTETYNVLNADSSPTSSLFANGLDETDKLTWNNFGFNPIKQPFVPRAGDFMRFEYSKQKVYLITSVNSSGNVLKLKLDGEIPASTILDNFVIYRIIEDGQFIILDVKKNNEAGVDQPFSGVISAEFPSQRLEERTDQLLFDLKQAGIISERDYLK